MVLKVLRSINAGHSFRTIFYTCRSKRFQDFLKYVNSKTRIQENIGALFDEFGSLRNIKQKHLTPSV